jgi:hypothetical protein
MTIFVGLFVGLFTIVAAGFGLSMLLIHRRLAIWECLALPWLLGTATVSLGLWLGGFFLRGFALQLAVTGLCVVLGWVSFRRWRKFPALERTSPSPKAFDRIFLALFVAECGAIVWFCLAHTLGWDGLTVWELKARYAFLNGGTLPVAYFSDVARRFSHPEYPLLLPLTETWFYLWLGDCDQFWIKLIFPIWYLATMSILFVAAAELSGRRLVAWTVVLLFPLVPCIHNAPGGIQVGYADLPLAAIYLAAILYLLRFARNNSPDDLALFIALAATLPWMKREGVILWAVIAGLGAMSILRTRRKIATALLSFLPGICVIVAWKIFIAAVDAVPSRDFAGFSFEVLKNNLHRSGAILHELLLTASDQSLWNIFWLLVVFALLAVVICRRATALVWLLLAPLACYCASYLLSAWPDYIAHIDTSLPRLLIQLTPVGWLLIALAFSARSTSTPPGPLAPLPGGRSAPETGCN